MVQRKRKTLDERLEDARRDEQKARERRAALEAAHTKAEKEQEAQRNALVGEWVRAYQQANQSSDFANELARIIDERSKEKPQWQKLFQATTTLPPASEAAAMVAEPSLNTETLSGDMWNGTLPSSEP